MRDRKEMAERLIEDMSVLLAKIDMIADGNPEDIFALRATAASILCGYLCKGLDREGKARLFVELARAEVNRE